MHCSLFSHSFEKFAIHFLEKTLKNPEENKTIQTASEMSQLLLKLFNSAVILSALLSAISSDQYSKDVYLQETTDLRKPLFVCFDIFIICLQTGHLTQTPWRQRKE